MPPKEKYTDPKLRDQVKQEIQESDKGGAPGQWSARKAQMMAAEYKKRGGDYNTDKSQQDESQKNLSKWGEEEWQTKEGSGHAKKDDGTEKRYLPKKAWEKMSEEEKQATEEKKQEGSKQGKQFVQNTGKAKHSRKKVNEEEHEKYEEKKAREQNDDGEDDEGEDEGDEEEDDDDGGDDDEEDYEDDNNEDEEDEADDDDQDEDEDDEKESKSKKANAGQKRKQASNGTSSNKKQKKEGEDGNAPPGKVGSKHMDAAEPGQRGSADRLPKKGASVTWKAMPGYVDGTLEEVLTKQKSVNGKTVKASKDDPRLVLKSNSSGKICVHKPDACFYD